MGNQQYCCNYKEHDPNHKDYADKAPVVQKLLKDEEKRELLKKFETKSKQVIKIQAMARGYLTRRKGVNKFKKEEGDKP
jgi:hypothetical protein